MARTFKNKDCANWVNIMQGLECSWFVGQDRTDTLFETWKQMGHGALNRLTGVSPDRQRATVYYKRQKKKIMLGTYEWGKAAFIADVLSLLVYDKYHKPATQKGVPSRLNFYWTKEEICRARTDAELICLADAAYKIIEVGCPEPTPVQDEAARAKARTERSVRRTRWGNLLLAQVGELQEFTDAMRVRKAGDDARHEELSAQLAGLSNQMTALEARLDETRAQLAGLSHQMTALEARLSARLDVFFKAVLGSATSPENRVE